jgi:hypothetical protein
VEAYSASRINTLASQNGQNRNDDMSLKERGPMLTSEQMKEQAAQLLKQLRNGLTKEWNILEEPQVLASMFHLMNKDSADLRELSLENTFEAYVGQALVRWLPNLVKLHDVLVSRGLGNEHRYEFGNDAYVYAVVDKQVKKPSDLGLLKMFEELGLESEEADRYEVTDVKAFVLETQSRQFIIVLNQRFSRWRLNIRRIYPSFVEEQANGGYLGTLGDFVERTDLTVHDIIALSHHAEKFADDIAGNNYPKRLSLKYFLDRSLVAGDDDAGRGLRYEDCRDEGYVASLKVDGGGEQPEVDGMATQGYGHVGYVMFNLLCAFEQLVEGE